MKKTLVFILSILTGLIVSAAPAQAAEMKYWSYVTGYSWWDNTPPGSADIAYSKAWEPRAIHYSAGGVGTYKNPITVAVGHKIVNGVDTPRFAPGTRFYIPNLRRYFIVEDQCGDGPRPQDGPCWTGYQQYGASIWLDVWVGGKNASKSKSDACMNAITKKSLVIRNPRSDYKVQWGDISGTSCTKQFGNTPVRR